MQLDHQLYKKFAELAFEVKETLREKGYVIPAERADGKIKIGNYIIFKNKGFFDIMTLRGQALYEKINLPQTALIIANSLALGQSVDSKLLENDQKFGYSYFEELNYDRLSKVYLNKRDYARFDSLLIKQELAQIRSKNAKNYILINFEKLRRMR
jgi:hypothetical protein